MRCMACDSRSVIETNVDERGGLWRCEDCKASGSFSLAALSYTDATTIMKKVTWMLRKRKRA